MRAQPSGIGEPKISALNELGKGGTGQQQDELAAGATDWSFAKGDQSPILALVRTLALFDALTQPQLRAKPIGVGK